MANVVLEITMIEVALAIAQCFFDTVSSAGRLIKDNHLHTKQRHIDDKRSRSKFRNPFRLCSHSV